MTNIHPQFYMTLHRLRAEEAERDHARVRAMRGVETRSWVSRLASAIATAVAAGRLAFAETAAARGTSGTKPNLAARGQPRLPSAD